MLKFNRFSHLQRVHIMKTTLYVFLGCASAAQPHKPMFFHHRLSSCCLQFTYSKVIVEIKSSLISRCHCRCRRHCRCHRFCQVIVRQMIRQMSNCHKSLKFVIYCTAYETERLFSPVLSTITKNEQIK